MRSFFGLLLFIFLSYNFLKQKGYFNEYKAQTQKEFDIKDNNAFLNQTKLSTTINNLDQQKNPKLNNNNENSHSNSKTENFFSTVITNVLSTDTGQKFFSKVINIQNNTNLEKNFELTKLSDTNLLDKIFNAETDNSIALKNISDNDKAICGNKIKLNYTVFDINGQQLGSATQDLILGSLAISPIVENLAINMRSGTIKKIVIPKSYLFNNGSANDNAILSLQVEKIYEQAPKYQEFKILDEYTGYRMPYMCGEKVKIHLKIQSPVNKLTLYDNNYEGILGNEDVPLLINYGATGSFISNKRTIITTLKFLQSKNSANTFLKNIKNSNTLDSEEIIIAEISDPN